MKDSSIIRNPLTIIAIFAGLAEVVGTVVLAHLDKDLQSIFIWFVMAFPTTLVLAFFVTLNFNHSVLYAPSDFRDDDAFLAARSKQIAFARTTKLREELEVATTQSLPHVPPQTAEPTSSATINSDTLKRTIRGTYFLAEELVLNRLAREYKGNFSRDALIQAGNTGYLFDASISDGGRLTAIEVKYQRDQQVNRSVIINFMKGLDAFYNQMSPSEKNGFMTVLAIVTDAPASTHQEMLRTIERIVQPYRVPVEVRVFDLKDLEQELESPST